MIRGMLFVIVSAASNHMQILAFLPALMMTHKLDIEAFTPVEDQGLTTTRKQAGWFCAFLSFFYVYEDLITPYNSLPPQHLYNPSVVGAYGVHLLMVLDFTGFFLYNSFIDDGSSRRNMSDMASVVGSPSD